MPDLSLVIAIAAWVVAMVACVWTFLYTIRIRRVYEFRTQMLQQIHDISQAEIREGIIDWEWRYEEYNAVSPEEMYRKVWKPLRSFYKRSPGRIEQ